MLGLRTVYPDAAALSAGAAAAFAHAAAASTGFFRVALSGGETPRALYERLAREPLRSRVPWPRVEIFFGDERCVPVDHPDSNYRMANDALLSRVALEPARIHRVQTELPPEEAARRYDALARQAFDWIFLGLGRDGHTASLFPRSAALDEKDKRAVAVESPDKKHPRVTLTLPVINAAANVLFVVSGAEKASMARLVLEEPPTRDRPASLVRPAGGAAWMLDAEAAKTLSPR